MLAVVFAGDRRVWRTAAVCAVPLLLLTAYYCLRPRSYYTGTDSVEVYSYVAQTPAGVPVCVPDLQLPAGTAVVRLSVISATRQRPALRMALRVAGQTIYSQLPSLHVGASRISAADFQIPQAPATPAVSAASLCLSADGVVNWGGTPLPAPPIAAPTSGGAPLPARLAIWYLPRPGAERSYLEQAGAIFARAALFRPGVVGSWTYPVLLFLVLPALALLAVRCLALAVSGRARRVAAWLFAIAAVNAGCWALVTPSFQAPDEVDHFAYVQSLVERGQGPSQDPASSLPRWSSEETLALEDMDFVTDHQVGDSRPPWLSREQREYLAHASKLKPPSNDGGGYSTSAVHGPLYYLALAPAYLLASDGSVFSQLTLMRLTSALLGALVAVFTFLLARELAPRRPWLGVVAALLVTYEPMYGFISGIVNNDVGVNAAAAALELLLIRLLRRGITIPWGALTGVVLVALPIVKGTGLSLYPVAGLVFLAGLWRYHSRSDLRGWAALALGALAMGELSRHVLSSLQPRAAATGASVISSNASSVSDALHNIPGFLSYLWQALLPRLPFMTPHFPSTHPYFVIFVERGWGAFGWYDVFFPRWVYLMIFFAMVVTFPLAGWAALREWSWLRAHWMEALALVLMPVAVIVGFEAAYYTPGIRPVIAEFGRYAFPAIAPLALLAVGALHAIGRRGVLYAGTGLAVAIIALSYASQLLTLTSFYA
jgi:hypothetical protein